MAATALDVADYFLTINKRHDLGHVKLEKLCAYAQAHSLGVQGRGLFDEDLLACGKGPVIRSVYERHEIEKERRLKPVEKTREEAREPFTPVECLIIEVCYNVYAPIPVGMLVDKAHREFPCPGEWGDRQVIPADAIRRRFADNPITQMLTGRDDDLAAGAYVMDDEATKQVNRALGF